MSDSVFIFISSKFMDHSQQFENHQLGFIANLYENNVIDFKHVITSVFVPEKISDNEKLNIEFKTKKIKELSRQYNFELDIVYIKGKTLKSLFHALKQIKEKAEPFTNKFIFAQNYYSGFIGFRLKQKLDNAVFHLNLRGVPAEEELYYSNAFILKRILNFLALKFIASIIISASDSLSVVSEQYKNYLRKKFKNKIKQVTVYPCTFSSNTIFIDEDLRKTFREKYNIEGHQKVFIYSGSMNKYQLPEKIFQFYSNISKQDSEKNCVFIFLSPDIEKARQLSKLFLINNLIVESASDKDLLGFYNASDTGVVIRKQDLVNRVASPTKIPEYLAAGNSIILTDGIGDFSTNLKNKKFALVKKDVNEFLKTRFDEVINLSKPDKNDLEWIKENYSNKKIKVYNEVFSKAIMSVKK